MRIADSGPDPLSGDGKTYHVKVEGFFSDSASGMTAEQAKSFVDPTDPGPVADAGTAFTGAAGTLHETARNMIDYATRLAGAWSGTAADSALPQFKQLHDTAINLANASQTTGSTMQWHASNMPFYKEQINKLAQAKQQRLHSGNFLSDAANKLKDEIEGSDPEDRAAAQLMDRYNNRIAQAYNALPTTVTKNLPPTS